MSDQNILPGQDLTRVRITYPSPRGEYALSGRATRFEDGYLIMVRAPRANTGVVEWSPVLLEEDAVRALRDALTAYLDGFRG